MVVNLACTVHGKARITIRCLNVDMCLVNRAETESQIKCFPGGSCRGFTAKYGGLEAAHKAFQAHAKAVVPLYAVAPVPVPVQSSPVGSQGDYGKHPCFIASDERPAKNPCLRQPGTLSSSMSSASNGVPKEVSEEESTTSEKPAEKPIPPVDITENVQDSHGDKLGHRVSRSVRRSLRKHGALDTSDYGSVDDEDLILVESQSSDTPKASLSASSPPLCEEQRKVVDAVLAGKNVFYTGSAGCGKSTVLKTFVQGLRAAGKNVHIVAPTGRAALDINGSTFWTYAG